MPMRFSFQAASSCGDTQDSSCAGMELRLPCIMLSDGVACILAARVVTGTWLANRSSHSAMAFFRSSCAEASCFFLASITCSTQAPLLGAGVGMTGRLQAVTNAYGPQQT